MDNKFINIHAHAFTVSHAPDYFLQTVIPNRSVAQLVQRLLQKQGTRVFMKLIKFFFKEHDRTLIEKYISFIEVGISSSQEEVFKMIDSSYKKYGDHGIVVLAQDLDTLDLADTTSTHKNLKTQIQELLELKRNIAYQKQLLPFLPVDPRTTYTLSTTGWLEKYINIDCGFCGIKMYPAAGFYPFDKRLDQVWKWASDNQVPVMTHCTRAGSFYLGTQASITTSGGFFVESLNPTSAAMPHIVDRTNRTLSFPELRDKNGIWCNVFGNPQCYEPVLEKYPNLKICFAHLGGSNEVIRSQDGNPLEGYPPILLDNNWYTEILRLMQTYKNIYSDISYTLNNDDAMNIIVQKFSQVNFNDVFGTPMIKKLMYGTDFYMTLQETEGTEPLLQNNFTDHFTDPAHVTLLAYTNTARYLQNNIYTIP